MTDASSDNKPIETTKLRLGIFGWLFDQSFNLLNNSLFPRVFTTILESIPIVSLKTFIPEISVEQCLYDCMYLDKSDSYSKLPNYSKPLLIDGLDRNQALWFVEATNRQKDDPVILFLHGGGYMMGLLSHVVWFLKHIYELIGNDRLSVLLLDYSLTPKHQFPTQLKEIDLVYRKLIEQNCRNIILAGDSAGGHLALTYLKWLNIEGIDIDLRLSTVDQLNKITAESDLYPKGLLLISPWLNMSPKEDEESTYVTNKWKDVLTAKALTNYGKLLINQEEEYGINLNRDSATFLNHYIDDETNWNKILPKNILVTIGENEVMKSDILNWCSLVKLVENQEFIVDKDSFHEEVLFFPSKSNVILENNQHPATIVGFLKKF